MNSRSTAYIRWFLFTVVFTITPLWFNFIMLRLLNQHASLAGLLSDGELYIVSCAISAHALGELFAHLRRREADLSSAMWSSFLGLLIVGSSGVLYGALRTWHLLQTQQIAGAFDVDMRVLLLSSYALFAASILVGVYAVSVANDSDAQAGRAAPTGG